MNKTTVNLPFSAKDVKQGRKTTTPLEEDTASNYRIDTTKLLKKIPEGHYLILMHDGSWGIEECESAIIINNGDNITELQEYIYDE